MPVQFHCCQCRRTLSVGQRKAGATVACPKCGAPNVVPRLEPASATPEATSPPPSDLAAGPPKTPASGSSALPEAVAFDEIPGLIAMIDSMPVAARGPRGGGFAENTAQAASAQAPAAPLMAEPSAAATPTPASLPAVSPAPPPVAPPPIVGLPSASDARLPADVQAGFAAPTAKSSALAQRGRRGRRDETLLVVSRKAVYAQAALMAVIALAALAAGYVMGRGGRPTQNSSPPAAVSEPADLEPTD